MTKEQENKVIELMRALNKNDYEIYTEDRDFNNMESYTQQYLEATNKSATQTVWICEAHHVFYKPEFVTWLIALLEKQS